MMEQEDKRQKIALFRFGVISDLVGRKDIARGEKEKLIQELCEKQWNIPETARTFISRSTILEWLRKYEKAGRKLDALLPKSRNDAGSSRCIDEETELSLVNLKKELPEASLRVLLKVARQRKIVPHYFSVSHQSIYRIFKRHGMEKPQAAAEDRRRFEVEYPNELWQSDCMHGPRVEVDGKMRKSYLFALLDDHSRLISHAQFYLQENIDSFQNCLIQGLEKRGLPRKLFVDNAPCFRSERLRYACACLGIALIYTAPYSPAAKGKIERLWRTIRSQLLALVGELATLEQLNKQLWDWIDKEYHIRKHSSTGKAPLDRYLTHISLIRPAPKQLRDYFRKPIGRTVDKDRTVSLNGKLYEAPQGLIGKRVRLLYDAKNPDRIEVIYEGKSCGFLTVLNLQVNSRVRRESGRHTELIPPQQEPTLEDDSSRPKYQGGELFGKEETNG